jgi:hypothetical protein
MLIVDALREAGPHRISIISFRTVVVTIACHSNTGNTGDEK